MVPERVDTITTETDETVDTDQDGYCSRSGLGMIFHDQERTTSCPTPLLQTFQSVIHRGKTSHWMENGQDNIDSQEKAHRPIPLFPAFLKMIGAGQS